MTTEVTAGPSESVPDDKEGDDSDGTKRILPATWAIICTHWECGTMTAKDMGVKYGVSATSLSNYFKSHKVLRGSKAHLIKKAAEVKIMGAAAAAEDPLAVTFEQKRKGRIAETREHIYMLSRANLGRALKIHKDIATGTRKEADCANDLKSLRHFEALIEKNRVNRLIILKAEQDVDEAQMPVLVFRDLSVEEIATMANSDEAGEFDFDLPEAPATLTEEEDDVVIEEGTPIKDLKEGES